VVPGAVIELEEGLDVGAKFEPLIRGGEGNSGEYLVIIWRGPVAPVVHDDEEVGAVLGGIEPSGVGEVVTDPERHPSIGFHKVQVIENHGVEAGVK